MCGLRRRCSIKTQGDRNTPLGQWNRSRRSGGLIGRRCFMLRTLKKIVLRALTLSAILQIIVVVASASISRSYLSHNIGMLPTSKVQLHIWGTKIVTVKSLRHWSIQIRQYLCQTSPAAVPDPIELSAFGPAVGPAVLEICRSTTKENAYAWVYAAEIGFPFPCMTRELVVPTEPVILFKSSVVSGKSLPPPTRVVWGFRFCAFVADLCVLTVAFTAIPLFRLWRRSRRARRGCAHCGYSRAGLDGRDRCPECGREWVSGVAPSARPG